MAEAEGCSVAVVAEAPADQITGCLLADRALCGQIPWLDGVLSNVRSYRGLPASESLLKWTDAVKEARRRGIRVHGHQHGAPRAPDEVMAELALLLLATSVPELHAVILLRDSDKESRRREGFEEARKARAWPFEVIVGVAETKRECWVLAAFEPADDEERELLEQERRELGFDPTNQAEALTASEEGAKKDAKRVLHALIRGDAEREQAALRDCFLDALKQRGQGCGLAAYLLEVERRLAPLLDPSVRS